ncbi:hypothetical protein E2C01_076525 [Portunus trituberculatus]|uniref:Uncharacterized protein n=1 Tax=Portunus trituberculatus TaxID=210409 RepID=A0A5B7IJZ2_PORTR|nr:hypothetical protein [Portunus trituberculatus]
MSTANHSHIVHYTSPHHTTHYTSYTKHKNTPQNTTKHHKTSQHNTTQHKIPQNTTKHHKTLLNTSKHHTTYHTTPQHTPHLTTSPQYSGVHDAPSSTTPFVIIHHHPPYWPPPLHHNYLSPSPSTSSPSQDRKKCRGRCWEEGTGYKDESRVVGWWEHEHYFTKLWHRGNVAMLVFIFHQQQELTSNCVADVCVFFFFLRFSLFSVFCST